MAMTSGEYVAAHDTERPPPPDAYARGVREQADKLERYAQRILARVGELRESAQRWEVGL
jgi:hypothetical protein